MIQPPATRLSVTRKDAKYHLRKLLVIGLLLFQSDDPEPDKPVSCDNHLSTPADMRCACGRAKQNCEGGLPQPPADVRMDKQCKTYCREQHCQCAGHGCRS